MKRIYFALLALLVATLSCGAAAQVSYTAASNPPSVGPVNISGGTISGVTQSASVIAADNAFVTSDSVGAAGTNQSTATALDPAASRYNVSTVASGAGIALPACLDGRVDKFIRNSGANTLNVYTNAGVATDTINGKSASSAVTVAAGTGVWFSCITSGRWHASIGADPTGTGSPVLSNNPALVTPNLGTPSAATLTNAAGLPISTGVSGLGSGVAGALANATNTSGGFPTADANGKFIAGTGTGTIRPSGTLCMYSDDTAVAANTTYVTTSACNIPANTLVRAGDRLTIRLVMTFGATAGTKIYECQIGYTSFTASSGAYTGGSGLISSSTTSTSTTFEARIELIYSSATVGRSWGVLDAPNGLIQGWWTPSVTWTSANNLQCAMNDSSSTAGNSTLRQFNVEFHPNNT